MRFIIFLFNFIRYFICSSSSSNKLIVNWCLIETACCMLISRTPSVNYRSIIAFWTILEFLWCRVCTYVAHYSMVLWQLSFNHLSIKYHCCKWVIMELFSLSCDFKAIGRPKEFSFELERGVEAAWFKFWSYFIALIWDLLPSFWLFLFEEFLYFLPRHFLKHMMPFFIKTFLYNFIKFTKFIDSLLQNIEVIFIEFYFLLVPLFADPALVSVFPYVAVLDVFETENSCENYFTHVICHRVFQQ